MKARLWKDLSHHAEDSFDQLDLASRLVLICHSFEVHAGWYLKHKIHYLLPGIFVGVLEVMHKAEYWKNQKFKYTENIGSLLAKIKNWRHPGKGILWRRLTWRAGELHIFGFDNVNIYPSAGVFLSQISLSGLSVHWPSEMGDDLLGLVIRYSFIDWTQIESFKIQK